MKITPRKSPGAWVYRTRLRGVEMPYYLLLILASVSPTFDVAYGNKTQSIIQNFYKLFENQKDFNNFDYISNCSPSLG